MKKLLLFLSLILLTSCTNGVENREDGDRMLKKDIVSKEEKIEKIDKIEERIKKMTVEEKIGQLIVSGIDGREISERDIKLIEEYNIGGFIFFKNNISNLEGTRKLIDDLNLYNKKDIDLFISVDEEGGLVERMPDEFLRLPSASKVGNRMDKSIGYEYGRMLGMRLNYLGFNMDFAPVLDINSNENNPVIATRSFSNDREVVKDLGLEAVRGLRAENVRSVVKHFPGHGDTDVDSHYALPIINKTWTELEDLELYPFKSVIGEKPDGVMVGHILFKEIDEEPASLSRVFIGDILREDYKYDGLVLSDDMTMGGIIENYSIEEASLKFIDAGGDLLLICHGYDNTVSVFETLKKAVEEGHLREERIDKSVYRILKSKEDINIESKRTLEEINNLTKEFINTL